MKAYLPSLLAFAPIIAAAVAPQLQEIVKANTLWSMVVAAILAVMLHMAPSPMKGQG